MRLIDLDEIEYFMLVDKDGIPRFKIEIGDGLPIVKAIPVEWILNKYRGKWEKAEMGRRDFQFIEVIDELLADWGKENEGKTN